MAPLIATLQIVVPPGTVHTLMGPSGSGKSSLLAAICGTLAAEFEFEFDGHISLNGRALDCLPTPARRVGILFQDDLLFAHMTVGENLLFAVPPGPRLQRQARVQQALHDLEMPDYADADPATLSGGQRGRVALMRAVLAEPQALLLDEPFSRLDRALRGRMRDFMFKLVRARGLPTLLVTHDDEDVADLACVTRLG
jgi:putative thiamine transport system ATP-binding protein